MTHRVFFVLVAPCMLEQETRRPSPILSCVLCFSSYANATRSDLAALLQGAQTTGASPLLLAEATLPLFRLLLRLCSLSASKDNVPLLPCSSLRSTLLRGEGVKLGKI